MSVPARRRPGAGELRALAYADLRALINALRTLRKRPGRALLWSAYALFIIGFALLKVRGPHGAQPRVTPFWEIASGDFWLCGLTATFGVVLASGHSRWLGVFSSRAEALFITRSQSPPALVATYLQLRAVAAALAQTAMRFAYLIVVAIPGGTSVAALGAKFVFFTACGAAIVSVTLPRALASGPAVVVARIAGWSLAVWAAIPLLLDGLRVLALPAAAPLLRSVRVWHPGTLLVMLNAGDLRAAAVPLAVTLIASAAFVAVARDAYPELYAISLANLEWRAKARARRAGANSTSQETPKRTRASSAVEIRWRGALAFVWADALAFSRRVSATSTAIVGALALAVGAGLAALSHAVDDSLVLGLLFGIAPTIYITIASTTGVRLAPVLRLPLFWLGDITLAARLAAWSFGPMWRDLALLALVLLGYVAVSRHPLLPLLALAAGTGLLALTRGVGLAVFAILPDALDQRGPAVTVRIVAALALLMPAAGGGGLVGFLTGSVVAGTLAGAVLALAESGVLVGFAAWRLAGRVDTLATA